MFHAVRIKNLWLTVISLIGVLFFVAICLFALRAGSRDTADINGEDISLIVRNTDDAADFIRECGYEEPRLLFEHEITVPKNWNDTYTRYNELQREQGFDLVPYKGKAAEELTFAADDGCVTLLVSDEKIIAAHICDTDGTNMRALITEE